MNETHQKTHIRSPRALFVRLLPIVTVLVVDLFFLALLDNLFYARKWTLILRLSTEDPAYKQKMTGVIDPIRSQLMKISKSLDEKSKIEQALHIFEQESPAIIDGENPWFRVRVTDLENHEFYTYQNLHKFRQWNNWTNCFISRTFQAVTTSGSEDLGFTVTFYYTSPQNWRPIELLVIRYWFYAFLFIVLSWIIYAWLSRKVLRPLERVGRSIETMIESDGVVLIHNPQHAIEHRFNRLARNQREILFGVEIERIVDALHSQSDDLEVIVKFLQSISGAIQKIYPFDRIDLYVYQSEQNRFLPLPFGTETHPESDPWPENIPSQHILSPFQCIIPFCAGDTSIGGIICHSQHHSIDPSEMERMTHEIKKQAENGLARAFTRSRTLTEERNRFGINLATNMGHDLTNIIASGKWDLDTIQRVQNLGLVHMEEKKGRFFLDAVNGLKNNLHFLQEMVDIYRSFGYTRHPRYEMTDMRELVDRVTTLFRLSTSQKLTIRTEMDQSIVINIEPRLLRMALFNLLANAAQAIRRDDPLKAGEISLTVKENASDHHVHFSVSDNGPGIRDHEGRLMDDVEIRRIFQSGFSTKEEASGGGLGLSWVHSIIVDFHHGKIDAVNKPGGGAQFLFSIPTNISCQNDQE